MYREVTQKIQVDVRPEFVSERSRPDEGFFYFAYHVRIKNLGEVPVQLLSRQWVITDGTGHVETVEGPGVVGEQPKLGPGEEYEYTSFCPLPTPTGNMRGAYTMVDDKGARFDVAIPLFFLRTDIGLLH